jgi:hypothetical protein
MTATTINAPSARSGHTAVWTGTEMIIWGGNDEGGNTATGGRYRLKAPVSLLVSSSASVVNEGQSIQLTAQELFDDGSLITVPSSAVAWSIIGGPFATVSKSGLATSSPVYRNTPASISGSYEGVAGTLNPTVLNVYNDNFPGYAADGLDDGWQVQYFGPNDQNSGPTKDPDGDDQNNFFECITNTDPTNPNSRLNVTASAIAGQPTRRHVIFNPIVIGRTYTVQFSLDLISWQSLNNFTSSDSGSLRTVTDLNAGGHASFIEF